MPAPVAILKALALLLVLVMVMAAVASRPVLWPQGRLALGLLGLALFLAVLGRWTAHARIPAVTLGNLLGGFVMFAVSFGLASLANSKARRGNLIPSAATMVFSTSATHFSGLPKNPGEARWTFPKRWSTTIAPS